MIRNTCFKLVTLSMVSMLLVSSCTKKSKPTKPTFSMVTTSQAEKLIMGWSKKNKKRCFGKSDSNLTDITTEEIRDKLQAQVFRISGCDAAIDSFLIKDKKAYPMSEGTGGPGLLNTEVKDINKDSTYELVYTYECGSGIGRTVVEAYSFDGQTPIKKTLKVKIHDQSNDSQHLF